MIQKLMLSILLLWSGSNLVAGVSCSQSSLSVHSPIRHDFIFCQHGIELASSICQWDSPSELACPAIVGLPGSQHQCEPSVFTFDENRRLTRSLDCDAGELRCAEVCALSSSVHYSCSINCQITAASSPELTTTEDTTLGTTAELTTSSRALPTTTLNSTPTSTSTTSTTTTFSSTSTSTTLTTTIFPSASTTAILTTTARPLPTTVTDEQSATTTTVENPTETSHNRTTPPNDYFPPGLGAKERFSSQEWILYGTVPAVSIVMIGILAAIYCNSNNDKGNSNNYSNPLTVIKSKRLSLQTITVPSHTAPAPDTPPPNYNENFYENID